MKSVHVPFGFYPDVVGGTEVYVGALASSLIRQRHTAVVAAPGHATVQYEHGGVPVHRFEVKEAGADLAEIYGKGDPAAAEGFGRILDRERPDVVHLHAFTRACSVLLVRKARARGIPVVFTYHTPTVSCARGTLMLWGETACDGALHLARCAACTLEGHGVPKVLAGMLGHLPAGLTPSAQRQGRVWTALRLPSLVRVQHDATRALFDEVDRIVAFRDWVRVLLTANGVPESKIVSSKHALCQTVMPRQRTPRTSGPLRLAFLGRLDATKGLDVLIRALRLMPRAAVTLDIYGTVQSTSGELERARVHRLAAGDPRVVFRSPVDSATVIDVLAGYDVLAVPSQWMETGPLVVLEAFAARVPVVASRLGGIPELVTDGVTGLLVADFRSPHAWATAMTRLCDENGLVEALGSQITEPASMDEVASEMTALYSSLVRPGVASSSTVGSVA